MSSAAPSGVRIPWLGAIALLVVLAVILLSPIGLGRGEFAQTIENALHAPLFALVAIAALAMYRRIRPTATMARAYGIAFVVALALGTMGEMAQALGGIRHAQWIDIVNDALGALLGLCWLARIELRAQASRVRRRAALMVMIVAGAIIAAPLALSGARYVKRWRQLPELVTWQSALGRHFMRAGNTPVSVIAMPPPWSTTGEAALSVGSDEGRWVGVNLEEPWPDWRDYRFIEFDLANPNATPLEIIVRINDRQHNNEYDDRFNKTLSVSPQTRATLRIPLGEVASAPASRPLDLSQVSRIVLFQDGQRGVLAYYVCAVRLAR